MDFVHLHHRGNTGKLLNAPLVRRLVSQDLGDGLGPVEGGFAVLLLHALQLPPVLPQDLLDLVEQLFSAAADGLLLAADLEEDKQPQQQRHHNDGDLCQVACDLLAQIRHVVSLLCGLFVSL